MMLTFDEVSVRYATAVAPAVNDLTLTIEAGERVALIGPSGAGKSTVLALAAGLALPTSGTVSVFGVDTARLGRRAHRPTRRRIGMVRQDFALVGPLRVAQNVAAGRLGSWGTVTALRSLIRPCDLDEIVAALQRVGIADKLWERTDRLSGGQQQRTAIARALFQDPHLLLADEPVSALDPARSGAVLDVLMAPTRLNGDRAVLASMHDAPLAREHCDRIVGLREGRVLFDLEPSQVTDSLLEELYLLDDVPLP